MTEQEMHDRMKEIDEERRKLRIEREEYEDYFQRKMEEETLKSNSTHKGKCFKMNQNIFQGRNDYNYIHAIKILDILDAPNTTYAKCLVVIKGYRCNCWEEYGVVEMVLPIFTWKYFLNRKKCQLLGFYEEIPEDEFNKIVDECIETYIKRKGDTK